MTDMLDLSAELAEANAEILDLRKRLRNLQESYRHIRVRSPLTDIEFTEWEMHYEREKDGSRFWRSWCPCCKKPLDIACFGTKDIEEKSTHSEVEKTPSEVTQTLCQPYQDRFAHSSYAYVAALWGSASGFALGALVLGQGLRRSGTQFDLVLMHTSDVPTNALQLLQEIWKLKLVEHVDANSSLFWDNPDRSRFNGVFTKLHALGLVEYDKVAMLDIDLVVFDCPDAMFDLPAPAALWRGSSQTRDHGFPIDGRCFFGGAEDNWSQTGGINAGVMILAPDSDQHYRALQEVTAPLHPERIPCAGPEQDYLSRFFAPYWTHLSVLYNFQLHQVFYALTAAIESLVETDIYSIEMVSKFTEAWETMDTSTPDSEYSAWMPGRLKIEAEEVHIVHFSGELKMWDRNYLGDESDEAFVERLLRYNQPYETSLWIDKQGTEKDYASYGLRRDCGQLIPVHNEKLATAVNETIDKAIAIIRNATLRAAIQWRQDLISLPDTITSVTHVSEIVDQMSATAITTFQIGDRVEIFWQLDMKWYPGIICGWCQKSMAIIEFDNSLGTGRFSTDNMRWPVS